MKRTISIFLALLMVFSAFSVNVTAFAASSTTYDYNVLADGTAELTKYRGNAAVVNIPTEISKSILSFGDKLKVSKVADTCFNNCTSIAEIGIPNGVTMNAKAVNGCTSLRQIYGLDANSPYQVAGGITVKDGVVFKVCAGNNFTKLEIPAFYAIGSYAFSDNTKLETIILHDNCRKIEANAFYNCPNLKNILYDGASMAEFNAIKVGSGNDVFKKAKVTVHYDRAHSYKTQSITKATLTKNGTVYKECGYCGKKVKQTVYYPKTIKLSKTSYVYDGKAKKPGVTVKGADGKTVAAKNYKVTYSKGRKNIGKHTVTVKFKGEYYTGTKKLTFTIKPKATKITKTTTTKNSFTVKYSKVKNCTGYQVQYATDSKFKNGKKTYTVSGTSKKVAKLKSGKTYYVRVRAYKTVNKKKYYSAWTAVKAVKTNVNLTNKQAKSLYVKAEKVASRWLLPDGGCYYMSSNFSDAIYIGEPSNYKESAYAYPVNHKTINSTAKLKKYVSNYFDSNVYNNIVNNCYRDINGKLYFVANWGIGTPYDYNLKSVKVISQNGNTAKIEVKITEYGPIFDSNNRYVKDGMTRTITRKCSLVYKNGKWLFRNPFYIILAGVKIQ
ncbi:MAG: leucine-rich repeat protein [Eubacterium sp.]|nr:leucine-rich repeat protein [Eubacterium sp.]